MDIRRSGEAARKIWAPSPNGYLRRRYDKWTPVFEEMRPERETLCHFVRVVLIWSTFTQFRQSSSSRIVVYGAGGVSGLVMAAGFGYMIYVGVIWVIANVVLFLLGFMALVLALVGLVAVDCRNRRHYYQPHYFHMPRQLEAVAEISYNFRKAVASFSNKIGDNIEDFFSMVCVWIVAKKWGICPFIDLSTTDEATAPDEPAFELVFALPDSAVMAEEPEDERTLVGV